MQSPPAGRDTTPPPRLVLRRRPDGKRPEHYAELCDDEDCPRFPCRVYKEGWGRGYQQGHADGSASGYAAGYSEGYGEGFGEGVSSASN